MIKTYCLFSLSILVVSFFTYILIGRAVYALKEKKAYSFLRNFPEEMSKKNSSYIYSICAFFFYCIGLVICCFSYVVVFSKNSAILASIPSFSYILLLFSILEIASLIGFILLYQIRDDYKVSLAIFLLFSAFGIVKGLLVSYVFLKLSNNQINGLSVTGFIALFLCLIYFLILLNPKLKNWSKLELTKNENNEAIYVVPKHFVLAYSQWASLFISFCITLISLIGLLLL